MNEHKYFVAHFTPGGTTGDGAGVPDNVYCVAAAMAERECTYAGPVQECNKCGEEIVSKYDRVTNACWNCTHDVDEVSSD
jgi:hypothetical protein